jgi:hypothetical protein
MSGTSRFMTLRLGTDSCTVFYLYLPENMLSLVIMVDHTNKQKDNKGKKLHLNVFISVGMTLI